MLWGMNYKYFQLQGEKYQITATDKLDTCIKCKIQKLYNKVLNTNLGYGGYILCPEDSNGHSFGNGCWPN
jgi:hypothetical protein